MVHPFATKRPRRDKIPSKITLGPQLKQWHNGGNRQMQNTRHNYIYATKIRCGRGIHHISGPARDQAQKKIEDILTFCLFLFRGRLLIYKVSSTRRGAAWHIHGPHGSDLLVCKGGVTKHFRTPVFGCPNPGNLAKPAYQIVLSCSVGGRQAQIL